MLMEERARRCAARKEQAVNLGVQQRRARLAPALDDIQNAFWQACRLPTRAHNLRDLRGEFGGFEDNRVPRQQRRNNMSIRQMAREIKRPKDGHDAMRTMGETRCLRDAGRRALIIGFDRDRDLIRHRIGFGPGFPKRFAHIARNGEGDVFGLFAHGFGIFLRDAAR